MNEKEWVQFLIAIGTVLALFLVVGIWRESVLMQGIAIGFLALEIVFCLKSIKKLEEPEIWVIQRFGRFWETTDKAGLRFIPWIFREIRAIIDGWEQVIELFKEKAFIDFREGGTAAPLEVAAGVKVVDARKAIYEVANWRISAQKLLESAVRNYLNTLTTDEALSISGANLVDIINARTAERSTKTVEDDLARWGLKLLTLTIKDFEMGPETASARRGVMERKKEKEAAAHIAERRAEETMGTLIQMLANARGKEPEEIRREIERDAKLYREIQEFAKNMTTEQLEIAAKAFQRVKVEAPDALSGLIALFKQLSGK